MRDEKMPLLELHVAVPILHQVCVQRDTADATPNQAPLARILFLLLCKAMLLQQRIDLVSRPKTMVDLAILGLADCGELDYKAISLRVIERIGATYSSHCSTSWSPWSCLIPSQPGHTLP